MRSCIRNERFLVCQSFEHDLHSLHLDCELRTLAGNLGRAFNVLAGSQGDYFRYDVRSHEDFGTWGTPQLLVVYRDYWSPRIPDSDPHVDISDSFNGYGKHNYNILAKMG